MASNQNATKVLLVSKSAYVSAMAECWMQGSDDRLKVLTPKEFERMEISALHSFKNVVLDSNSPKDLDRFQDLFEHYPYFVVLASYNCPISAASSGAPFQFYLKADGLKSTMQKL